MKVAEEKSAEIELPQVNDAMAKKFAEDKKMALD